MNIIQLKEVTTTKKSLNNYQKIVLAIQRTQIMTVELTLREGQCTIDLRR